MSDIPKEMLKPRKPRHVSGHGEAWYYVTTSGIEMFIAAEKGRESSNSFRLTTRQLERALEIIKEQS